MNETSADERTQPTNEAPSELDRLVAELHWALSTAIEDPAQRGGAIQAFIMQAREVALRDAEAFLLARLELMGIHPRVR